MNTQKALRRLTEEQNQTTNSTVYRRIRLKKLNWYYDVSRVPRADRYKDVRKGKLTGKPEPLARDLMGRPVQKFCAAVVRAEA